MQRRPEIIWRGNCAADSALRRDPMVYPYRPDWFAEVNHGGPLSVKARQIAFAQPLCAAALLERNYGHFAAELEPALQGDGESVSYLVSRARESETPLLRPAAFYRRILREDPYWGQRFAQRSRDPALTAELLRWSDDCRHVSGAAAAWFLMHRPREPVTPYADLIRANPFYAYVALPQLHPRGFRIGATDAPSARWAFHFSQSVFSRDGARFDEQIQSDPAWQIEQLAAGNRPLERSEAERVMAGLKERHSRHPLLARALQAVQSLAPSLASPGPLRAGRTAETRVLSALQREKNREIWRPSPEQLTSPEFKQIVGLPRYTERGFARGTIVDSVEGEFAEIKSGSSALSATYQLRLQAYRAWVEDRPLKIYTNRPVDPEFERWRKPLGVAIEPLPTDLL